MSIKVIQNLFVGLSVLLLVLFIWLGINSGRARSQSKAIIANSASLTKALNYFYSDYDRYPSSREFNDQQIMQVYLSKYPPISFITGKCQQSYFYDSPSFDIYKFAFCLPQGYAGFKSEWNTVR